MPFEPFFPPSAEITRQLMRRLGERRASRLREEAASIPTSDEETRTPDELLNAILGALESDAEQGADADWEDQRWLSEVVYHFLGFQAGRARRGGQNQFSSSDIVEGMRDGLGLHEAEDLPLLEQLAEEFSVWLREQGTTYTAGWGVIVRDLNDWDHFRLDALPTHVSEDETHNSFRVATGTANGAINLDLIER
jgi:hypothetical protein